MNASEYRKLHNRQKGQCTWCGEPVGKGRQTWCSDACVDAWRQAYDWTYIRRQVYQRDAGVCQLCGCDTVRITRLWRHVRQWSYLAAVWLKKQYQEQGFNQLLYPPWQADHIVPRVRGGGNELENLRTLCEPCHKVVTAELASERAIERRDAEQPLFCDDMETSR